MNRRPIRNALLGAGCALFILVAPACNRDRDAGRTDAAAGDVAATETTARVTEVELGRAIGSDNRITEGTDDFRPGDTIYASVVTEGGTNARLTARWTFEDGQVVDETTQNLSASGREVTEFHISRPGGFPAGSYTLRVLLNDREVETESFRVSN